MPINARAKGKRGEREFIEGFLLPFWPEAKRNMDQFSTDLRDVLGTPGLHWQIKRVENLSIWAALNQAETEARNGDMPVVAFRRNRSGWYCALRAEDLVPILFRESWKNDPPSH